MKKIILVYILAGVAFGSCKKENKNANQPVNKTPQTVTYNVGFAKSSATAFQTNSLSSSAIDTSLTNHISVLYYMVFDSIGNNVHNITQLSTDINFGHYSDNLQSGKYTVAIAGGGPTLMIQPGNLSAQYLFYGVLMEPDEPGFYIPGPFDKDAFGTFFNITVGNTAINPPISLTRIVSKLVININDAIPKNISSINLTITSFGNVYYPGTGTTGIQAGYANPAFVSSVSYNSTITAANWGVSNFQLVTLFLYSPANPITTNIIVGNGTGQLVSQRNIYSVTAEPNKITLFSGNLFGGNGTNSANGFKVSVDTTWNTPVVKTF